MATQIVPQVRVFQEFNAVPSEVTSPLRAFIFGPDYNIRSYEANKNEILVGAYDPDTNQTFSWPGRQAGESVDISSVRVFFDDALICYYDSASINVSLNQNTIDINNLSTSAGWKAYKTYNRFSGLPKDVEVGDIVKIGSTLARVTGFRHDIINSNYTSPVASGSNPGNSSGSAVQPSGKTFSDAVPGGSAIYNHTNYRPYTLTNCTSITYTFTIIEGGLPNGTAKARITSTNNFDDVAVFTMPADNVAASFGRFGASVTFDYPSSFAGFSVGQSWQVVLTAAYTATSPTLSGTYSGSISGTFVISVVTGGKQGSDVLRFLVSAPGYSSGVVEIPTTSTSVTLPGIGLQLIVANNSTFCQDNAYFFTATAQAQGRVRYLLIDKFYTQSTTQPIKLCAVRNIEILSPRYNAAGFYNWTASSDDITINSGIISYINGNSILTGLPVLGGKIYVEYRALTKRNSTSVQTITDVSELPQYFTDVTPRNPLGFAVKKAIENSAGVAVKFMSVATNDLQGYINVLESVLEREDVYSFVPLTRDKAVLEAVVGHVKQQSTPEKGRWRIAWVTVPVESTVQITPPDIVINATITGTSSPTGYKDVNIVSNNINIVDLGVRAGDIIRAEFSVDGNGNTIYKEYVIDSVISATRLTLLTGPSVLYDDANGIKIEIWRNLTLNEQIDHLNKINTYSSRRVYVVIGGHQNEADGFKNVDDMYLAAAYAGLRGSVAPHQGLTNVALGGFTKVTWTSEVIRAFHRDALMNGGYWVVEQNQIGDIYCRKQLSSDITDINTAEQSVTTNVDSVSYYMKRTLAPYIGRVNNVESIHNLIRADLLSAFDFFINNKTVTLGSQILPGTEIAELRPHAVLKDRLVIRINLVIPYPLNNIDLYLVV